MDRCNRVGETMTVGQVKEFTHVTKTVQTIRWNGDGDVADKAYIATRLGEDCDLQYSDRIKDGFFYLVDADIAQGHNNKLLKRWQKSEGPESLWLFWRRGGSKPVRFTYLGPIEPVTPFQTLDDPDGRRNADGRPVKVWKFRLLCPDGVRRALGDK